VFDVTIDVRAVDGKPVGLQRVRQLPPPSEEDMERRIATLQPGHSLERRIPLRTGFKVFVWQWKYPDPVSVESEEVVCCVPPAVPIGEVVASYAKPGWDSPTFMAHPGGVSLEWRTQPDYTMNYGLPRDLYAPDDFPESSSLRVPSLDVDAGSPESPDGE
jgi:hypothetical protein